MPKIFFLLLLMFSTLGGPPAPVSGAEICLLPGQIPPPVFPRRPGMYWIYEGLTRWTDPASAEVREERLTWKMEVVDTIDRGCFQAAVLKGHPQDLVWYDKARTRGDYLLVSRQGQDYYLVGPERYGEVLGRLGDPHDDLAALLLRDEMFFPAGSGDGSRLPDGSGPDDGNYSWQLTQLRPDPGAGEDGEAPPGTYRLLLRTRPDDFVMDIVPGVGITRYIYNHHGTVSATDVRLVEFFSG